MNTSNISELFIGLRELWGREKVLEENIDTMFIIIVGVLIFCT